MSYPRPVFDPARTRELRRAVAFLFAPFRPQLVGNPAGYNPRDVDGKPYGGVNVGWVGMPSRHAYSAAFDFMTNRPEFATFIGGLHWGTTLRDWAVAVAGGWPDPGFNSRYGTIVEVIHDRRIWTPARGDHPYNGRDPHLNHVHVGLHCVELPDPR